MKFHITNGSNMSKSIHKTSVENAGEAGFTLMELLVVLVIIGLLAAFVGPIVYQHIAPAKATAARTQIEGFATALDNYLVDIGRYPTSEEGLAALRKDSGQPGWLGPYLKKEVPLDPWGNSYAYRSPGRSVGYEIISFGSDGLEGGTGNASDIESWRN